jgi:hypothetical protein
MKCGKCGTNGKANIIDVPYRSLENVRLVRINPEYIDLKYNDATGKHTYLYSIPDKLKRQIMAGDADIFEETPKIYLDAIRQRKKIKLSYQNLFHLKLPTVAGKDMGWGIPPMTNALKDLFYYYTLRRGQEAIMLEHITPFDIIFPQSNGKFDPYVHSDLSNWKREWERQLANRRKDPNYKAVVPFPVGYERISGDGKNMLLTPEMDFLSKVIIGSMGIPQEFVYGGNMQWSGSSISLRTLENEFLHHRSQLLQMNIWVMDRLRIYLGMAIPKSIRFTDFKMADDMQKMQMMINLAQANKLDWEDIYKELGKDPEVIRERIMQEKLFEAKIMEQDALIQAEAQAKAQQIQARIMASQDDTVGGDQAAVEQEQDPAKAETMKAIAKKMIGQPPEAQQEALQRLAKMDYQFSKGVEQLLSQGLQPGGPKREAPKPKAQPAVTLTTQKPAGPKGAVNMKPLPTQKPPRRQGGI